MFNSGDIVQLVYKDNKTHSIQIVESKFVGKDLMYYFLESGPYKISNVKAIRNLTQEDLIDEEAL